MHSQPQEKVQWVCNIIQRHIVAVLSPRGWATRGAAVVLSHGGYVAGGTAGGMARMGWGHGEGIAARQLVSVQGVPPFELEAEHIILLL